MNIRITTLSENTAADLELLGEWGISMLVEADDQKILFDTGLSISASHNAGVLGIDLRTIEKIVFSHAHIDHTGGLRGILMKRTEKLPAFGLKAPKVEVIGHPELLASKWFMPKGQPPRFVGLKWCQDDMEALGVSFNLSRNPIWITDEIVTTGEVPMVTDFEGVTPDTYIREGTQLRHDDILDDLSLIIKTQQGLVIISGCAHRGIINNIRRAQEVTGIERVYAVIGGTHLGLASQAQLEGTIKAFRQFGVQKLGVSHCTGLAAAARLANEFGDKFFFNNAGTRTALP